MKFSSSNASKKPPSPQDGFAVRQAIAQQFASAADFEETMYGQKKSKLRSLTGKKSVFSMGFHGD